MKINNYDDLEKLGNLLKEKDLVVDFSECDNKIKRSALDFLSGLTFYEGSIEKIDNNNFKISLNRK